MCNLIITKDGKAYYLNGEQHHIFVSLKFKMSLKKFLESGGVRVKTYRDHIAIEAGRPLTAKQKAVIRRVLKDNDYFSLVISVGDRYGKIERFRPIRSV